eukprot:08829_4
MQVPSLVGLGSLLKEKGDIQGGSKYLLEASGEISAPVFSVVYCVPLPFLLVLYSCRTLVPMCFFAYRRTQVLELAHKQWVDSKKTPRFLAMFSPVHHLQRRGKHSNLYLKQPQAYKHKCPNYISGAKRKEIILPATRHKAQMEQGVLFHHRQNPSDVNMSSSTYSREQAAHLPHSHLQWHLWLKERTPFILLQQPLQKTRTRFRKKTPGLTFEKPSSAPYPVGGLS